MRFTFTLLETVISVVVVIAIAAGIHDLSTAATAATTVLNTKLALAGVN